MSARRAAAAWRAGVAALALTGCAGGSQMVAQWSDAQYAGQPPRGALVMVECRATDLTVRRICADRMAAQLVALGLQAVPAPDPAPLDEPTLLRVARSAGAAALWRATVMPEAVTVAPVPSIGIGIGGFGGGYRGGGGIGVGVSAPIGTAGAVGTGLGASAALHDVASGGLMWSGRASATPSSDLSQQVDALAAQLVGAAHASGLFGR